MYVVTVDGKKLKVDDSPIDYENEWVPFHQTVGLYTNDTVLTPIWLLVGERGIKTGSRKPCDELEFRAEKVCDHEPSKEEILWFMSANGLSRGDIVYINKGYALDTEGDE